MHTLVLPRHSFTNKPCANTDLGAGGSSSWHMDTRHRQKVMLPLMDGLMHLSSSRLGFLPSILFIDTRKLSILSVVGI